MKSLRTPLTAMVLTTILSTTVIAQDDPGYVQPDTSKEDPSVTEKLKQEVRNQGTPQDEVVIQQDDSGTIEGFGGSWRGLKRLERIQFLSDIATIRGSNPLLPLRSIENPLDFSVKRPTPLGRVDVTPLLGSPLEPIIGPFRNIEYFLESNLGMNFGIYYTLLYQHVTNPIPGTRSDYGTGRLDVNLVWNLWEYPLEGNLDEAEVGHGLVGVLVRQGNQIGVPNDQFTNNSVGSIQGLDSLYTGQFGGAATLNLLYYQQGFWNDRIVFSVGKLHPNQYIGLNFWANDESRQFLAAPFDGIQTLGPSQGGYQLGAALQFVPADWMFVNTMITDSLGSPYTMFSTLDEGYYWSAVEMGFLIPSLGDDFAGPSALSIIWTNQNINALSSAPEKTTSNSVALQFQGHLSSNVGIWAQGGVAEEYMSSIESEFSCGIGIEDPIGRKGDLLGVAFNWSKPSGAMNTPSSSFSEQSMFEIFYRIQLTGSCQLSPDIQVVLDPGNRSGSSTPVIFGLRLTTDF
jgi:porin